MILVSKVSDEWQSNEKYIIIIYSTKVYNENLNKSMLCFIKYFLHYYVYKTFVAIKLNLIWNETIIVENTSFTENPKMIEAIEASFVE